MKFVGAHVSAAGGVDQAVLRAHEIKATAFALLLKTSASGKPHHYLQKLLINLKRTVNFMVMALLKFYPMTVI